MGKLDGVKALGARVKGAVKGMAGKVKGKTAGLGAKVKAKASGLGGSAKAKVMGAGAAAAGGYRKGATKLARRIKGSEASSESVGALSNKLQKGGKIAAGAAAGAGAYAASKKKK